MEMVQPPIVVYIVNIDAICIQFRTDSPLRSHTTQYSNQLRPIPPAGPSDPLQQRGADTDNHMTELLQTHAKQDGGIENNTAAQLLQRELDLSHHRRVDDRLQHAQLSDIPKYSLTESSAIDGSFPREDLITEMPPELFLDSPIAEKPVADLVHIDFCETQRLQEGDEGVFSGTVLTGDTKHKGSANGCPPRSARPQG